MSVTPADETSMTVEAVSDYQARITVERGNGDFLQTMELTTQEWRSLQFLLETFGANWAPATHLSFKAITVPRSNT